MLIHLIDLLPEGIPAPKNRPSVWKTELKIDSSSTYMLRGTSGRGKSTFLHILSGIRKQYKGHLEIDGINTNSFCSKKWAKIRQSSLGIVFQDLRLIPHLTARQNLSLKGKLHAHDDTVKIQDFSSRLKVEDCLEKRCDRMSFGQQQRIAIIRALIQPFQFLLLDEPFSHLDPENIERCLKLIQEETQNQRCGYLLTTLDDDYGIKPNHYLEV